MLSDPIEQLEKKDALIKYKKSGRIAANIMQKLVDMCKPGVKIYDICSTGDKLITEAVNNIYPKIKKHRKGCCFPTSLGVNHVMSYFCPLKTDTTTISDGDLLKIELGVHIDGYPALLAYTVVVNTSDEPITDKRKSIITAVTRVSKDILKNITTSNYNTDVVDILNKYAKLYGCNIPIINQNILSPGIISYQISRYVISGYNEDDDEFIHRIILNRDNEGIYDYSLKKLRFEEGEIYAIDIVMCTNDGKVKLSQHPTSIYKLIPENKANLILKSSREVINDFRSYRFPKNLNNKMNSRFKFGLRECIKKGMVEPYHVVEIAKGEYAARVMFTVLVGKTPTLITARSMDEQYSKLNIPIAIIAKQRSGKTI